MDYTTLNPDLLDDPEIAKLHGHFINARKRERAFSEETDRLAAEAKSRVLEERAGQGRASGSPARPARGWKTED